MADPFGGKGQLADMGEYFAAKLFQFVIVQYCRKLQKKNFEPK